ncbi:tetratricopeptide repeat protein [Aureliella helgolandensis]|uniref:Tetratricopeptide repeat protein n=1 Tax=Aureliella helgolandensis TaxID=2527968 RepID=A0A518G6B2_9BACT|nr:tetratricopeptide repeat protein [Aureliella helgolandensis]QDV24104.1 Tetratricopeptide repeat protein [Aureliella helgolandensis]
MQLDPFRWPVSIAGFVYDWIITREWKKVLLVMWPVYLLIAGISFVFIASRGDHRALAQWYMELGDEEIAGWEQAWAPAVPSNTPEAESSVEEPSTTDEAAESEKRAEVSPFADVLFRRAQLLSPTDRAQFVIGATMAQRGAVAQAERMLVKIAPNSGPGGYAPAHAVLSEIFFPKVQRAPEQNLPILLHHLTQGARWERMPVRLLLIAAKLFADLGRGNEALSFMATAAERDPSQNVNLARLASALGNPRVAEQAGKTAEEHLRQVLQDDPKDAVARLTLAQFLAEQKRLDEAERLLFPQNLEFEVTPDIQRAQSEVYRLKFRMSVVGTSDGKSQAQIGYLDRAMRLDPTNPRVPEEIAQLAGSGGSKVNNEMVAMLRTFLAEGKATVATHAWLAETFLKREDYEQAIPHLEQVVIRLPTQPQSLNNLAYSLAASPSADRLEEALDYAQRCVISAAAAKTPRAEYYDTMGIILTRLERNQKAITAFENAIEIAPTVVDYHRRAAELYRRENNPQMAKSHEDVVRKLNAAAAAEPPQPASNAEAAAAESTTESPSIPADDKN